MAKFMYLMSENAVYFTVAAVISLIVSLVFTHALTITVFAVFFAAAALSGICRYLLKNMNII